MSFGDHLEELRKRLLLSLLPPIPLTIIAYFFSSTIIGLLELPLFRALRAHNLPTDVQYLHPAEAVLTQFKLSIIFAVIVSGPWIIWQLWKFVSPGLYQHERRFVRFLMPGSAVLTLAGVALMYFIMLPMMLNVLIGIGQSMNVNVPPPAIDARAQAVIDRNPPMLLLASPPASPHAGDAWMQWPQMRRYVAVEGVGGKVEIVEAPTAESGRALQNFRLSDYISFVLLLFMGIVLAFQMPLVILLLGWVGIVSPQWLGKQRRYAVFVCAIISIVITPGDVISMLAMMVPLYGLYELGILLLRLAPASAVARGSLLARRRAAFSDASDDSDNGGDIRSSPHKSTRSGPSSGSALAPADSPRRPADDGDRSS